MGSPPSLFGATAEPSADGDVLGERGTGGAAGGHRTCFLHPLQGSGVILFCIHLTAASDKVGNPGLIKMSEF